MFRDGVKIHLMDKVSKNTWDKDGDFVPWRRFLNKKFKNQGETKEKEEILNERQ